MITKNNKKFESNIFAMQIIAHGGFVDKGTGNGKTYYINTINLRANHIMQNEYILSSFTNSNNWEDCYETKEEWAKDKRETEERRKTWIEKVKSDLMSLFSNIYEGSCLIQKVNAEFFTVMHVYEITR